MSIAWLRIKDSKLPLSTSYILDAHIGSLHFFFHLSAIKPRSVFTNMSILKSMMRWGGN